MRLFRLSSERSRSTAEVLDSELSLFSMIWLSRDLLSVFSSDDDGVNVEYVSSIFDTYEISSDVLAGGWDGIDISGDKWQENIFNSWLRTGRTTLTESVENNERRILFVMGEGEVIVGFNSIVGGDLWLCFSAINASKSDTRAVVGVGGVGLTKVGIRGLIFVGVVLVVHILDLFTIECVGRGRVTVPVTGRNCSGDFDKV